MNAAILLVTSAWMTGQTPEIIVPVQHAAPANHASCGGSCCDDGCGNGHRLRDWFRGLCDRRRNDDCCETQNDCDRGHRFSFHRRDRCDNDCGNDCDRGHRFSFHRRDRCEDQCDNGCDRGHRFSFHRRDRCDSGCGNDCCDSGGGLLERLRGMFHRDRGCGGDTCCGSTGSHPAPVAEPLKDGPKKMPSKGTPAKEVRIITPPAQAPINPAIQNAPAINNTRPAVDNPPATAPRIIESDVRNPF